jgi:hypothetical protein
MNKLKLTSFQLHIMAMFFMLLDHLWASLAGNIEWMTCVGRLAFPIFAFMVAEGFSKTSNVNKYLTRTLVCGIITEVPFNLMYNGSLIYPFHQNVLWTYIIAILCMKALEKLKDKKALWRVLGSLGVVFLGYLVGNITMVDYYGAGVLMVLLFYFTKERKPLNYIIQVICMYIINVNMLKGYYYPIELFGHEFELIRQGFAMLALIPIWFHKGEQGYHKPWFKWFCYLFYPIHMLILGIL